MDNSPTWQALRYHEETKHHRHRPARSLGYLDWETQPNPFRTYEGITPILLPLLKRDPEGAHLDLYERAHNVFWDFNLENVAGFLELSLGLSAWKSLGASRWPLRINPSSGNLHPTECHLILPFVKGSSLRSLEAGVYHYNSYPHALEPRVILPSEYSDRLRTHFQSSGFLVGLTSIYWREAWKYGERALRYCHHDAGHTLAALSFAANLLGWKVTVLSALSNDDVETMLGLKKITWPSGETEEGDLLCFISPSAQRAIPRGLPPDILKAFSALTFEGQPNTLSRDHVVWDLIDETALALKKPRTPEESVRFEAPPFLRQPVSLRSGAQLIRQRRSAVSFDGVTSITKEQFVAILDKALPRNNLAPFDAELGPARVHLLLFVHRVIGLAEGLYFLIREPAELTSLKRTLSRDFVWTAADERLPLYLLKEGDYRSVAAEVSCQQPIAGQSAFSLGMIAQFRVVIDKTPWAYKSLFWECGMIGQALYLEAEAQGVRGTGIGCFFDDSVHEIMGLRNNDYQSLYHFTIGGPVEDSRLTTEAPYFHLPADRQ